MTVTRSRLLLSVAAVLAGAAALFAVLGAAFNVLLIAVAAPFAAAAYFLWSDATGRLQRRIRRRVQPRDAVGPRSRAARSGNRNPIGEREETTRWASDYGSPGSMDREEALATLDLSPGADDRAVRRAYRDRVKAVHPDGDGGDEAEFRRVRAAYERLRAPKRGKG